jgi:hypothetical protein
VHNVVSAISTATTGSTHFLLDGSEGISAMGMTTF